MDRTNSNSLYVIKILKNRQALQLSIALGIKTSKTHFNNKDKNEIII